MCEASRTAVSVIRLYSSPLQLSNYVTYSTGHFEEMVNKNLGGFMPLIHVLWYLDMYLLDCEHADAVVVVDDTPAMAAKIAMSDESGGTKVVFLGMSAIKQKDLANSVRGALQHAIIMRYMLEANQTEQGVRAATWNTQEEWLLRGIPLWDLDSNPEYQGHQKVHAAEAVQEQIVTEAPADDSEPDTYLAKTSQGEEHCQSCTYSGYCRKGQPPPVARSRRKERRRNRTSPQNQTTTMPTGLRRGDSAQLLETQQKRKRAPASHFDASPDDSGKDQPKNKGETAAAASTGFNLPSRSGAQSSRGTIASPSGTGTVARSLGSRLVKVAGPKKKKVTINPCVYVSFRSDVCARPPALAFDANAIICPEGLVHFCRAFLSVLVCCAFCVLFFFCLLYTIFSATLSARGLAH